MNAKAKSCVESARGEAPEPGPRPEDQAPTRSFLSRPLGQEANPDPWDAWAPFMTWLSEHSPERFAAICEAEEAIRALEQHGVTAGEEYEEACAELLWHFEEARRMKLSAEVKVWMQ